MKKAIRFTFHARQKFNDLAELGFTVSEEQVIKTVESPEYVHTNEYPPIAQRAIDDRHLLRVVFREEKDEIAIVTFYPARRKRYES